MCDRSRSEPGHECCGDAALEAERDDWKRRTEAAEAALQEYGEHRKTCPAPERPCDCGFDALPLDLPRAAKIAEAQRRVCEAADSTCKSGQIAELRNALAELQKAEEEK